MKQAARMQQQVDQTQRELASRTVEATVGGGAVKVAANCDGTLASIMAYLNEFFPGQVSLIDTTQMELQYIVEPTCTLSPTVLEAYLPKPMGVGIVVVADRERA